MFSCFKEPSNTATLLSLTLIFNVVSSIDIFIKPSPNCLVSCVGTMEDPFYSIWEALQLSDADNDYTLWLLHDEDHSHYFFTHEDPDEVNPLQEITLAKNVQISPLFCDN